MRGDTTTDTTQVVMPVGDLRGRTVWTEGGERLGTISSVETDDDGRVYGLNVRERWMLGPHHNVGASGMRLDDGDVILPEAAVLEMRSREGRSTGDRTEMTDDRTVAPALVAGRDGASSRYGGFDVVGSLFGGLVTIASIVLVGGILAAIFGTGEVNVDTSLDSLDAVTSSALLVGAATLLLAGFLGGWAAGRSSRFAGVGNGIAAAVWALAFGVGFGLLGAWLGSDYDVYANTDLPRFTTDEFALWGSIAFATGLVLLLLGGALGGAVGERWHRRVDRALMQPVSVGRDGGVEQTAFDGDDRDRDQDRDRDRDVRIRSLDE